MCRKADSQMILGFRSPDRMPAGRLSWHLTLASGPSVCYGEEKAKSR